MSISGVAQGVRWSLGFLGLLSGSSLIAFRFKNRRGSSHLSSILVELKVTRDIFPLYHDV